MIDIKKIDFEKKYIEITRVSDARILISKFHYENYYQVNEYFKNGVLYNHLDLEESELLKFLSSRTPSIKKIEFKNREV